jgi:hypothetical protein
MKRVKFTCVEATGRGAAHDDGVVVVIRFKDRVWDVMR